MAGSRKPTRRGTKRPKRGKHGGKTQPEFGGQGEETPKRSDLVLLRTAIRRRWLVPEEADADVPEKMLRLVSSADERCAIAAARVLVAMQASNLRADVRDKMAAQPPVQVLNQLNLIDLSTATVEEVRALRDLRARLLRPPVAGQPEPAGSGTGA